MYALEKQTRSNADLVSNRRILVRIVELIYESKDYKLLNENIVTLSKKHGLIKAAVTTMVQKAVSYIDEISKKDVKMELIDTLKTVTEDKIFLEIERAKVTRTLAQIKEAEGNVVEAADIMQALPVETFGSMERGEKTDFILEQMRLSLAKKDYTRTQIISKKINTRMFRDKENEQFKLRYYNLLIEYHIHEEQYLDVCKSYYHIYESSSIVENEQKLLETLKSIVVFIVLASYDNEQNDLLHRINSDVNLSKIPSYKKFLECFVSDILIRWNVINEVYSKSLSETGIFNQKKEDGEKRWKSLHKRVVEHNIRVISKFYNRITIKRLTELLDLNLSESEEFLSELVTKKTIYARIDRPAGIINFQAKKNPNEVLNEWSNNINSLLGLIVKTTHLITKEEMVHSTGLSKVI